ncbi:MAG: hypothetical protein JWM25_1032 [Thermoleophilia bacterium]|nr:hypothetical protein [Thermoleophilia bacterium]
MTPSETGRIAARDGDARGALAEWAARSFPNTFPLTDPHEIVVPTPRHVTSWRELTLPELQDAIVLILRRRAALVRDGFYVHVFVNDGVAAGASLAHAHAQLVVLAASEQTTRLTHGVRTDAPDGCVLCAQLDGPLLIERGLHHSLLAHPVPRMAGGLLITANSHDWTINDEHPAELAALLHRALQAADPGDLNIWLVADESRQAHWYMEIQPRTANLAGVELALGLNVSAAEPADTATTLRERLAQSR